MLRNEMWKVFEATGNISAYLYYRNCLDKQKNSKVEEEYKEKKIVN